MSVWRDIAGLPRARWQEANIFHGFEFPKPVAEDRYCVAAPSGHGFGGSEQLDPLRLVGLHDLRVDQRPD